MSGSHNVVVYFTKNNARIMHGAEAVNLLKDHKDAIVAPQLHLVAGVEPHFWKRSERNPSEILPMDQEERNARKLHMEEHGVDNHVPGITDVPPELIKEHAKPQVVEVVKPKSYHKHFTAGSYAAMAALVAYLKFKHLI